MEKEGGCTLDNFPNSKNLNNLKLLTPNNPEQVVVDLLG